MKFKTKFLKIFLIFLLSIPTIVPAYSSRIIPGGSTIGIEVNSKNVLVVGFYKVDNELIAKKAGFKLGDKITKVNDTKVSTINDMVAAINASKETTINFKVLRDSKELEIKLVLPPSDVIRTGMYVKDKISGIGTLSYIDPETKIFGSLGHEILESNTAKKFEIKNGKIYEATVSNISKSKVGNAGEKNAIYNKETSTGDILENSDVGIYGKYTDKIDSSTSLEIGKAEDVTTGEAYIKTVINSNIVEDFKIEILSINKDSKTKNILFQVTDEKLLDKTGGIVQGMSGSPIIQNNKLVGAVNYVIVNEPTKGYGIFITTMLEEGEN